MSDDFKTNNIENRLSAILSFCLFCLFVNVFCNIIIIPDFFWNPITSKFNMSYMT